MPGEQGSTPEQPQPVYALASQFPGEEEAGHAYLGIQTIIYAKQCDLSAFRFFNLPDASWHVVIIGRAPSQAISEQIQAMLAGGISLSLPHELIDELLQRRAEQTRLAPWVERHYPVPEKHSLKKRDKRRHKRRRHS